MSKTSTIPPDVLPTKFEDLCRLHWPRPIHDSVDCENTAEMVDRLALLSKRTADQDDYLEALSTLIEKYDKDLLPSSVEAQGRYQNSHVPDGGSGDECI
jgi:hypothetical protein